jgi:hypothetical protein
MSDPNPYAWRPSDLEAIRRALLIPVSAGAIGAINDAMAQLERSYPDAIPGAKANLDAIAAIDGALSSIEPGLPAAEPVVTKTVRKGAAVPIPDQLPTKKLDVIEYATDLLMEEVTTEYEIPASASTASGVPLLSQRRAHVDNLLLILPRLRSWQRPQPTRFQGRLIRS